MYCIWFIKFILAMYQLVCIQCSESKCGFRETCGACISYPHETCVWCTAMEHKGSRCGPENGLKNLCNGTIYTPTNIKKIVKNKPLGVDKNAKDVVQLTPQKIKVKVSPGQYVSFNISYKPYADYPLDIYYLIDNSNTMAMHRVKLQKQGKIIPSALSNITNNVRLGVGSYVEKPALPYASINNVAYSFKHHLSLTSEMDTFVNIFETLTKSQGTNYDDPEAAFDALMQTMVCEEKLNWRMDAWRIIVLFTDNTYHSAGDGKMVGAFKPNDMKCYLENNTYTMDLKMDYPSVSQINKIASDKAFRIIFTATKNVSSVYKTLAERVKGSTYVELKTDSNLVQIIKEKYQKLLQTLQLHVTAPEHIQISMSPDCRKINECGIKLKETKEIQVTLKAKTCSEKMEKISIMPMGLNEAIVIELETDCKCLCEESQYSERNSLRCESSGTYQCGICKCNKDRYGENCGCLISSSGDAGKDIDKCKFGNDTVICSGRGSCRCGKCVKCNDGFSGKYCEFDDNACVQHKGKQCAGHGKCTDGFCHCDDSWEGHDCSCPKDNSDCIPSYSTEVCSGSGRCVCGNCVCDNKQLMEIRNYAGNFCDISEDFDAKQCEIQKNNILDKYCSKMENEIVCKEVKDANVLLVNKSALLTYDNTKRCTKTLDNGCLVIFKIKYLPSIRKWQLLIQREEDCSPKENMLIAIGSVIGISLLIGLLTAIVWKIIIDIHDKREYDKFLNEARAAGLIVSQNPLYIKPETQFINPAFQSNSI